MGRKYYLDPVTKEKIYIRNTVSKPPVIDVQVDGESVLEDRIAKINLSNKQDTLISGVNIKTINNESILGSGNIRIAGGSGGSVDVIKVNGVEQPNSDGVVNLEVPTKTSELINDSNFLTEHQDLSNYATKSEIPDVSTFITQEQLEAKDYADKAYVAEKVTEAVTGGQVDLSPYLKKTEASSTYVKKEAGKSLIADTEITRLASVTNYDDTSISNRIKTVEDNYSSLATVATSGSYNDLTNKPAIPDESTVSGWGFTKNTGTVTSVKMNNAAKNPVNGVIDLGTVITAHQDISGKQDTISDLATIRAGAAKGATALQSIPSEYITETELEDRGYLTSESDPVYTADKPNIALKSEIPTKTSQLTNDSGYVTDISGKVDKVSGKGLSTNDYTTAEKNKLAGIAENANNYTHPSSHAATMINEDAAHRFVTDTEKATWNAKSDFSGSYTDLTNKPTIPTVDAALSSTSTNAIQNKAVNSALTGKADSVHTHTASDVSGLATVATSGSYRDLTNTPAEVTESTISGWGFTKSSGTVTSVKMNNTSKTPVNGVIDLGTVITDISGKQDVISDLDSIRTNAEAGAGLSTQVITNKNDITNIKGELNNYLPLIGGTISGNITPNVDNVVSLGSDTKRFKEIYAHDLKLSANSLYLGDTKILGTDADTINIKGNAGQNVALKSQGSGTTNIQSFSGVTIETVAEEGANPDGSTIRLKALGDGSSISMDASSIGLTGNTTVNNLTVTGNLNVSGTTTTVNSQNLDVKDNIIEINKGETGAGVSKGTAGIKIDRGSNPDFLIIYDESDTKLKAGLEENVKPIATEEYVNSITDTKLDASATATSAEKLTKNAGSTTQPIYFSNGVPVNTTYTLGASVPADAKFTDTTYTASDGIAITGTNITNSGVRSIDTGSANGTISVNIGGTSKEVAVKGLGTAAYTSKDSYAAATHSHAIADVTDLQTALDNKQATISSTNKLSADLLSEGTTNKLVSASEKSTWNAKQNALVSGTNIKTINNTSLLGSGNIELDISWGKIAGTLSNQTDLNNALNSKQSNLTVNPSSTNATLSSIGINGTNYSLSSSAGNIRFAKDLKTHFTLGKYNGTLTNPVTIPTKDKTIEEVLSLIYTADVEPTVIQPYISGANITNGYSFEVGTTISPSYEFTFNAGNYEFGPDTGVSATSWSFSDSNSNSWTNTSGTGTANSVQIGDSTNYVISATASYSSGAEPYNNDHTRTIQSLAIPAGTTTSYSTPAITGFRNMFIGYTTSTTYDSSTIRALNAYNSKSDTTSITLDENTSAKSIIIAFPSGTQTFSAIMPNSANVDVTSQFIKQSSVSVAGANNYSPIAYDIYVYTPARMAGTYMIDLRRA